MEVYGGDHNLRMWLQEREQPFVLAVAKNEPLRWKGPRQTSAQEIAQSLRPWSWKRRCAGPGAKGERLYDWALAPLWRLQITSQDQQWGHYLPVRRSLDEKRELAYCAVYASKVKGKLKKLVQIAGRRWEIEIGFEATKGECGLDHYEVRRWRGWYRHITLSLLAHAALVALRVQEKKKTVQGLIALSVPALRRLLSRLLRASQGIEHVLHWSIWRRKHQYCARQCHYKRRACAP